MPARGFRKKKREEEKMSDTKIKRRRKKKLEFFFISFVCVRERPSTLLLRMNKGGRDRGRAVPCFCVFCKNDEKKKRKEDKKKSKITLSLAPFFLSRRFLFFCYELQCFFVLFFLSFFFRRDAKGR